jgi:hypothetical protein
VEILAEENFTEAYKILKPSYTGTTTVSFKTQKHSIESNKHIPGDTSNNNANEKDEIDHCIPYPKDKLRPFTLDVNPRRQNEVKKSKIFGSHPKMPVYSMCSQHRGVFFLVNIIEYDGDHDGSLRRNGAEQDRDNLIALFRGLEGYTIFYYEDLTREVRD